MRWIRKKWKTAPKWKLWAQDARERRKYRGKFYRWAAAFFREDDK